MVIKPTYANKSIAFARFVEEKYGKEQLVLLRILLANPIFRAINDMVGCISLDTYLSRFFSAEAIYEATFEFKYWDPEGEKRFVASEDFFLTVGNSAMTVVQEALHRDKKLVGLSKQLTPRGQFDEFDENFDDKIHHIWDHLERENFENQLLPVLGQDYRSSIDQYNEVKDAEDEESRIRLFDAINKIFTRLRVDLTTGKFRAPGAGKAVEGPLVSQTKISRNLGKVACHTNADPELLAELEEVIADEKLDWEAYELEGKLVIREVKKFDPFSIIGSEFINMEQLWRANFIRKNRDHKLPKSVRKERPAPIPKNPAGVVELVSANFAKPVDAKNIDETYYGSTKIRQLWDQQQKRTAKKVTKAGTEYDKVVEAVSAIEARIVELLPNLASQLSQDEIRLLAVGRLSSLKGQLNIVGDRLTKK